MLAPQVGSCSGGSGNVLFLFPMPPASKKADLVKNTNACTHTNINCIQHTQIAAVLEDAGSRCGVRTVCVYGGVPKGPQVAACRSGVEVIVGTPGRLEDLMNDNVAKLTVRLFVV